MGARAPAPPAPTVDVVVPTTGRASLAGLLEALGSSVGPLPGRVILADDRPAGAPALRLPEGRPLAGRIRVVCAPGRGPAAASNAGWRASSAQWVAFLDDDVVPGELWLEELAADLAAAGMAVGGVQGRLHVPLPEDRPATDW